MQDLDERLLEPGDLEAVLDPPDESHRVDVGADVLEQAADEAYATIAEDAAALYIHGVTHEVSSRNT